MPDDAVPDIIDRAAVEAWAKAREAARAPVRAFAATPEFETFYGQIAAFKATTTGDDGLLAMLNCTLTGLDGLKMHSA